MTKGRFYMSDKTAEVIRLFQEELAKYRAYAEYFGRDAALLFEGLADGQRREWNRPVKMVASNRPS
jgi:hypothetical protein